MGRYVVHRDVVFRVGTEIEADSEEEAVRKAILDYTWDDCVMVRADRPYVARRVTE